MPMPPNLQQSQDDEYAAAFGEDMPPAPDAPDMPPEAAAAETPMEEGNDVAAAEPGAATEEAAETPAAEAAEPPAEQQAEQAAGAEMPMADAPAAEPAAPALDIEKERQRLKSWEGRLKAQQAALDARAAQGEQGEGGEGGEGDDKAEQTAEVLEEVANDSDNSELTHAALDTAEQVEAGKMSPQEAMASLAEDFGPDFVRLIEIIAEGKARDIAAGAADEKVGDVRGTVAQLIDALNDEREQSHFRAIHREHPDFEDVGKSPEFQAFIMAMPDDERAEAERITGSGDADEIIGLLHTFKRANARTETPDDDEPETPDMPDDGALDAAEGVRSAGLRLPEQPKMGGSYEDAWRDFA